MSDVRGKWFVKSIEVSASGGDTQGKVTLGVVSRGAINASWAEATPSGEMSMWVSNPSAFKYFQDRLGKELYVDFTEYTPTVDDGHRFVASPEGHYNRGRCAECGGEQDAHKARAA